MNNPFNRIFLTGDKHGDFYNLINKSARYGISADDLLIILGDVGVNYYGSTVNNTRDDQAKQQLSQISCTVLCIHGNHEMRPTSEEISEKYHRIEWMGGAAYVEDKYPRLIFAEDGARYHINGRDFLVIGGAYSVDKWYRLLHRMRWFPDEQLSLAEMDAIRQEVSAHGNREDIILAHTCPFSKRPVEAFLSGVDDSMVDTTTEKFLQEITDSVEYNQLYCGHWHIDKRDGKTCFLFQKVIEMDL